MANAFARTLTLSALGFVAGHLLARSQDEGRRPSLHPYLGMPIDPGWTVRSQETETEFESAASLAEIYGSVHEELASLGWRRTTVDESGDEIEAHYVRGGMHLDIELEREGEQRFELEVDLQL